ncbi:MAG: hypothetical protein OEW89_02495 [Gammaproteobacteria bacterium]|nr:hypothetical protein [Gammaproteobacteria bacterium]
MLIALISVLLMFITHHINVYYYPEVKILKYTSTAFLIIGNISLILYTILFFTDKQHISLKKQWNMIKPIWRILLVVGICQVIGTIVSVMKTPTGELLPDMWHGGALATAPGFFIGMLWQYFSSKETLFKSKYAVLFFGFICIALTTTAIVDPIEKRVIKAESQKENLYR